MTYSPQERRDIFSAAAKTCSERSLRASIALEDMMVRNMGHDTDVLDDMAVTYERRFGPLPREGLFGKHVLVGERAGQGRIIRTPMTANDVDPSDRQALREPYVPSHGDVWVQEKQPDLGPPSIGVNAETHPELAEDAQKYVLYGGKNVQQFVRDWLRSNPTSHQRGTA